MKRKLLMVAFALTTALTIFAQDTPNGRQARKIFDQTYQMVFGPQGSTLHYAVNLIGLYKTQGIIWYKGKKSKFVEPRYDAWNDGVSYTRVDKKKKTVAVYGANDPERDKYASKFKFDPENFTYHIADDGDCYLLTLKAKKKIKGVSEVSAWIDKHTRYPKNVKVKVALFSAHIKISNFKSGGISDDIFVFPAQQYKSYKVQNNKKGRR